MARTNDPLEFRMGPPDPKFLGIRNDQLKKLIEKYPRTQIAYDAKKELKRRLQVCANLTRGLDT